MNFLWILIPSLLCGAFFAYLAMHLMTTKGNTISDILKSEKFASSEAIRVEIMDKIKVVSNIPIVALFIVAFAVAVAFPSFFFYLISQEAETITLTGNIEKEMDKEVYVAFKEMKVEPSGAFMIPLRYTDEVQEINIEGQHYYPITLTVELNKLLSKMVVEIKSCYQPKRKPTEIDLNMGMKRVRFPGQICLIPIKETHVSSGMRNPAENGINVNKEDKDVPSPKGVGDETKM